MNIHVKVIKFKDHYAFTINDDRGRIHAESLTSDTRYYATYEALFRITEFLDDRLKYAFFLNNKTIVEQLQGTLGVRDERIKPLHKTVQNVFKDSTFILEDAINEKCLTAIRNIPAKPEPKIGVIVGDLLCERCMHHEKKKCHNKNAKIVSEDCWRCYSFVKKWWEDGDVLFLEDIENEMFQ